MWFPQDCFCCFTFMNAFLSWKLPVGDIMLIGGQGNPKSVEIVTVGGSKIADFKLKHDAM